MYEHSNKYLEELNELYAEELKKMPYKEYHRGKDNLIHNNIFMNILTNLKNLLVSTRFKAFYWQAGSIFVIGFLNLLSENIVNIGLPYWAVVCVGSLIAQITKGLNNLIEGKEMGWIKE